MHLKTTKKVPAIILTIQFLTIFIQASALTQSELTVVNTSAELQQVDCIHRNIGDGLFSVDAPLSILPDGQGNLKTLWCSPWGAAWYSGTIENKNLFSSIIPGTEKSPGNLWIGGESTLGTGGIPSVTLANIAMYGFQNTFVNTTAWIMNLYQVNSTDYLGFVHIENVSRNKHGSDAAADRRYAIGLAYSTNAGVTWSYLGDIIRPKYDIIGDNDPLNLTWGGNFFSNIGGAPYIVKRDGPDEYFYVYFNEFVDNTHRQTNSVARAKKADVLAAASAGGITAWGKLSSTSPIAWGTDNGLSPNTNVSAGASIISGGSNIKWWDMHADAAFCAPLNKYLLTASGVDFTTGVGHRTLELYASDNGVAWVKDRTIDEAIDNVPVSGQYTQFFYPSFYSNNTQSTADSRTVGSFFNIVYMRQHGGLTDADLCTKKYRVDIGPAIRLLTLE